MHEERLIGAMIALNYVIKNFSSPSVSCFLRCSLPGRLGEKRSKEEEEDEECGSSDVAEVE